MKYLNSFNSVGALNNFYKGKDYKEPNVNVIKTSENEDPIVDMSSEYEIICFFDTTENLNGSPDLITNYDLTSLESIIVDGNRYEVKDLPLNKSELEPSEHIIKLKYKNKTTFGNISNNSPVFMNDYLKKVIIPKGIETLHMNVFLSCQGLDYIKIPNTVKSISNGIMNSSKIKILDLSEMDPTLFNNSFLGHNSSVYIDELICPNNLETIVSSFGGLNVKKVNLGQSLTEIPSGCFSPMTSYIEEIIMPNTVTSIGNGAFGGCSKINSINLPSSLTLIGESAFGGCSSLISITIPDSVTSIGNSIFGGCSSLTSITIPDSVTSIGESAFGGCSSLTSITIPDSVTSIGNSAFSYCSNLEEVNISNNSSLTTIGDSTFNNCNITSINIPNSVTSIGNSAFRSCIRLTEINLGNSVTSIGNSAFDNCNNLTSINIPNSVTSIGGYAFSSTKISNINISNNLTSIGSNAFSISYSIRPNVYFDNSTINNLGNIINTSIIKILEIGQHAITQNGELCLTTFEGFGNLETITFPEGLTKLPNISNFSSLKTLNIPLTITSIDDNYFYGCNSLEDSYLEDGIRYIDIDNFGTYIIGVTDYTLQNYTIKNGVKSLPFTFNSSFTNIQSITLPNSLTNIADGAFDYLYENNILTSQQINFILNINENGISKISRMMKQPTSYFEDKYFSVCALESGTLYYTFNNAVESNESENYKVLEYSKDNGTTWLSINNIGEGDYNNLISKSINIIKNDIILFRSVIQPLSKKSVYISSGSTVSKDIGGIGYFYTTFNYYVCGNIMSLLYGNNFINQTSLSGKNSAFYGLFFKYNISNYNLKQADKLILPATTLSSYCYSDMFKGCRSLTTAPELPATTLDANCYYGMFKNCTSLTTTPSLPATSLANNCYTSMFEGCTSLIIVPKELPATTLIYSCYNYMFQGCTSLTTAPELPATILSSYCYLYMFQGCTALTTAPELPATTLDTNCYYGMFKNCTSLTTAPEELPATTLASSCYSNMFQGCTALTTAPELPATTLANNCCDNMFNGCTSLTTTPDELPATTLANTCYRRMFQGCTSLTTAPELPATTLANDCYSNMFYGCTALTTAPELPATTLAENCYFSMFGGCTALTTAPELPATTLANDCYMYMFSSCTSLIESPVLKASFNNYMGCYSYMFQGCSNLNKITMLAPSFNSYTNTADWVNGVAATGTFIKNASMTSLSTGNNGIPEGWTVQDYEERPTPRELPVGYTEVKYIASTKTGGQYIDLNILLYDVLNKNYDIAMKFNLIGEGTGENTDQGTIFGCQDNTDPWPGTFIRKNSNNVRGRYIGGDKKDNDIAQLGNIIELTEKTPPSKNVYNYNNSEKTHTWGTSLFCAFKDSNNTPFRQCEAKIYYFKLFVEGTLVRDLVPCINSSNVPGLYDVVNNVFYTSLSSNPFIYESYQS